MIGRLVESLEWSRPALWPVAVVPVIVLALGIAQHVRARRRVAALADPVHVERLVGRAPLGFARTALLLRAVAACALVAALLGPVAGHVERRVETRGIDLVVCLDASRSMLARDERPDLLTRAKREIAGLLERVAGDRVALIAFAGEVQRVAPLTTDRRALLQLLEGIRPEDFLRGGTDLGGALDAALELFDGRSGAHEAIVIVTDGEDLEGRGAEVAERAGRRGVRVFVVGIGTRDGGKIPVLDARGNETLLRDPEGQEVVTRLEPATLERLARASGGEFLSTERSATPLETLYERRISRLDGRVLEGGVERLPLDRYQWALVVALVAWAAAALARSPRRRRVPRAASIAAAALLLVASVPATAGAAGAQEASTREFARAFAAALEQARTESATGTVDASDEVLAALADDPRLPESERALVRLARAVLHHEAWRAVADGDDAETITAHVARSDAEFSAAIALAGPGARRALGRGEWAASRVERAERERGVALELEARFRERAQAQAAGEPARDEVVRALEALLDAYRGAREPLLDLLRDGEPDALAREHLAWIARRIADTRARLASLPDEPEPPKDEEQQRNDEGQPEDGDENEDGEPREGDEPREGESQEGEPPEGGERPEDRRGEQDQDAQQEPGEPEGAEPEQAEEEPTPTERPSQDEAMPREAARRLLDRLAESEREAQALREALLRRRRVPVARDW